MGEAFEGLFDAGNVLERVGVELTALARRGDLEPVRCRDAEVARVVDILLRQSKNNPALIGKAGVGKTAIVEGLAQRIAAGDVPPALKDARILALGQLLYWENLVADRGRDDTSALRYEDIIADSAGIASRLSAALGLNLSAEIADQSPAIHRTSRPLF